MEDSFFGFNTTLSADDEKGEGGILDLSEDEYDALNDETFGSAINGDWETQHESMVRMDGKKDEVNGSASKNNGQYNDYDDLEQKLSSVKLDDVIVPFADDDDQSKFKLDPSVWSNNITHKFLSSPFNFPQPPNSEMPPSQLRPHSANILKMFNTVSTPPPKKITTLEDIERNMKQKQMKQQQQHHHHQQQQPQQPQQMSPRSLPPGYNMPPQMNRNGVPHIPHQSQQQPQQQQPPQPPPPNFNQMPPHPPFNRMPPGYPPFMPPRPPLGSLPIALNNFAMHPSFNAMRPNGPPPPLPFNNHQHPIQNQAQFNQQLLNEIQRNHPLLNRQQPQFQMASFITQQLAQQQQQQQHHHHQLQQHHQHQQQLLHQKNNSNNNNINAARQQNQRRMQNSNEEYDEYANLMSTRDKHWLIGIQLSQLNSDTPYIDDYYYTTYREREAKKCGDLASKTHKDNQLNHPLTQPKGQHAKLVMVQLGNKNGNRNGQINNNHRERRNSENKSDIKENSVMNKSQNPQFENSLGKLQYGSVTAPRKLIDMAIDPSKVRTTTDENQLQHITAAASLELSSQRKYRLILLHIETLYKILLKLEDSMNPTAIIAYAALKESQKEKKEQQMLEGSLENIATTNAANEKIYELEPKEKLIEALLPGITKDKVIGMMNVRKGRNLISRIIPHIAENGVRWVVWSGVFLSMNNSSLKKEKEDNADTIFNAFYPEFKKQISEAPLNVVVMLGQSILAAGESEKKSINIFSNKLSISSMVALILQAERTFDDPSSTDQLRSEWTQFLKSISSILSKTIQNHTVSVAIESDAITPLREHFSRFKDLKLEPLLNLFSQNDNYN